MTHPLSQELKKKQRVIPLRPIAEALDPSKTAALPAFHSFTGADVTGSSAGKGKLTLLEG